ncbi:hypothetical protein C5B42_02905 [Candidatus Cerribacteria bacterium 'Amazon FNV 2010 28 9']|uniref:Uncharacterized protein n=1 Tax=Candidatus Cerribacteria bacterium 'Amazon FNV 2010 28 9' TaxID=2081795 RepID=A0A317JPY6_9BACT|nr:MAG: hypothetical protein C5B42_02905 [Candidatus Cerribacteria bacterium 'Amazon FNV 2010 28 9']
MYIVPKFSILSLVYNKHIVRTVHTQHTVGCIDREKKSRMTSWPALRSALDEEREKLESYVPKGIDAILRELALTTIRSFLHYKVGQEIGLQLEWKRPVRMDNDGYLWCYETPTGIFAKRHPLQQHFKLADHSAFKPPVPGGPWSYNE